MKDQAKHLAHSLGQALKEKGVYISQGQSLDIAAKLLGTKDWNALSSVVSQRRDAGQLRQAVQALLAAMTELSANAGKDPQWSKGGAAYEACQLGRRALGATSGQSQPPCSQAAQPLKELVENLAATPLRGEFCAEAPNGVQDWDDFDSTYARLEDLVSQARRVLNPQRDRLFSQLLAKVQKSGAAPDVLDELVYDLAEENGAAAANTVAGEDAQERALDVWSSIASETNNMGVAHQVAFLIDGYGVERAQHLIEEALQDKSKETNRQP